jgi:hypothetical protein
MGEREATYILAGGKGWGVLTYLFENGELKGQALMQLVLEILLMAGDLVF